MLSQYNYTMVQILQSIRQVLIGFWAVKSVRAENVRAVLTEENCSASLCEYLYSHNLVMASLKCGLLAVTNGDWWFYNDLYVCVCARNICVGGAERSLFQGCLSEAKDSKSY